MSVPTEHRTVPTLVLAVFATYLGDFKYQVAVIVLNCAENASIHRQAINIIVSERAFPNCSERHRRDFNQIRRQNLMGFRAFSPTRSLPWRPARSKMRINLIPHMGGVFFGLRTARNHHIACVIRIAAYG